MNEFMLYNLVLYMFMYFLSFHLVLNSDDWFMVWLGLEINMMMFIMLIYNQCDMNSSESCLSYFFIQSLGSAVFMSLFYLMIINVKQIFVLVMSYKIGAGPFFFWFPSLCGGISWMSNFLLLTFQKIIPLVLMNLFMNTVMVFISIFSFLVGVMGSFNQSNLKYLLAYSSIFHLGWIIMCNMMDDVVWLIYLLMYMFMLMPLVYFLMVYNIMMINEVSKLKNKFYLVFLMLSMAGMPPFLGFFVKWFALGVIFKMSYYLMMVLVICSVIMFYIYFRMMYDILLYKSDSGIWVSWNFMKNEMMLKLDGISILGILMGSLFFTNTLL